MEGPHEVYTHSHEQDEMRMLASRRASSEAAFLMPYLKASMSLLDCGCGPGTITVGLAQAVSPGQVVGLDASSEEIEYARKHADQEQCRNVKFETGSVYELPFPDKSFDVVFASGLLEHLKHPTVALQEMQRVLKPGGRVAIRDVDAGYSDQYPASPLINLSWKLVLDDWKENGADPMIGRRLRQLLVASGFEEVEASFSLVAGGTDREIQAYAESIARRFERMEIRTRLLSRGWAKENELRDMAAEWRAWGQTKDAVFFHLWAAAMGRKSNTRQ